MDNKQYVGIVSFEIKGESVLYQKLNTACYLLANHLRRPHKKISFDELVRTIRFARVISLYHPRSKHIPFYPKRL